MDNPLGQSTDYPQVYAPERLFAIERAKARASLAVDLQPLPFRGYDLWSAYEVSWLDQLGKPQVSLAQISVDCHTPALIESKSLKLYLNSLNQQKFTDHQAVRNRIQQDLSSAINAELSVRFFTLETVSELAVSEPVGVCLDNQNIAIEHYQPNPDLLQADANQPAQELVYSHLLKTNCPITGQPDWATIFIEYVGPKILWPNLLAYLISFRQHQDYHEHCIETIFCDIKQRCQPDKLSVYGRYSRRGGLDINPFRTDYPPAESLLENQSLRLVRQ